MTHSNPQPIAGFAPIGPQDEERWYVVMTQPHREKLASANLGNQGFRCFLPQLRVTRRHARQFRTTLCALFPRYLFVTLDLRRDRWRSINGTFGVQALLTDNGSPRPVQKGVVETLAQSSDPDGGLIYRREALWPGDRVRLVAGPLAGALGLLQSLDEAGRVRLLMQFLGGSVTVTARRAEIEAAR